MLQNSLLRHVQGSHRSFWMWAAVAGIAALYVVSTLPSPLYPIYRAEFGISGLTVTAIYAIYVIGNLAVLFALGRISDQLGRRPVTLVAFGILCVSVLCFLASTGAPGLYISRVLNGVAAGLGAGALTAWIAELEPAGNRARAAMFASSGNLAGLALGSLLAGLLAQYGPWPLRTSYAIYLILLLPVVALIRAAPEGVEHVVRERDKISLRPRIGVPREIRPKFIAPAAMAFAAFALGGFYAALTPSLVGEGMQLAQSLRQHDIAVIGALVGLFFAAAATAVPLTDSLHGRRAILVFAGALLIGLGLLVTAEYLRSMTTLTVATLIGGFAMALGYRGSLQIVNEIAPQAQRAEVVSSYLIVGYTANSLPVIGVGLLTTGVGALHAHLAFAVLLALLAIAACATGWKYISKG